MWLESFPIPTFDLTRLFILVLIYLLLSHFNLFINIVSQEVHKKHQFCKAFVGHTLLLFFVRL